MKMINIPQNVIDALAKSITFAVQDRIDHDPDVADAYMRITATDGKFSIRCMYIEEHFGPEEDSDTALLDLMIDRNQCEGNEDWHPNPFAIHRLAEQYSRMLCITKSDLN